MDRKTRKLLTIHGALHPRSNVSRLYLPRREGGRGLISVEDAINIEERNINVYVCQSQERLLKAAWKRKNVNEIETPKEYKEKMKRKRTEDWSGKQLYGQFKRETDDLSGVSWEWIRTGELKKETEGLIFAAQDQALRTNAVKARIENKNVSSKCMKLRSIFYVVAPSLRRQNIKRGMMLLGGSFIGRCARNMELSAVTNGMSIPPKA